MSEYIVDRENIFPYGFQGEEIVRCKDCAHMRKSWNGKRSAFVPDGFFCAYWGGHELWEPDGFCKWGERRGA